MVELLNAMIRQKNIGSGYLHDKCLKVENGESRVRINAVTERRHEKLLDCFTLSLLRSNIKVAGLQNV